MDGHNRQVNVIEELIVILHRHAGGEEDHQLLLAVLLQECKKQQEALLRWAYHIALGKKHTQFTTHLNTQTIQNTHTQATYKMWSNSTKSSCKQPE